MDKLFTVGHASDKGMYDFSRVKTWFKNVNIFEMDKIFVPINHGHLHWICAVLCMMEKKICMYDSMGSHGMEYLEGLLHFINDEHMSKKGVPLYDISEWELVGHISQLRITELTVACLLACSQTSCPEFYRLCSLKSILISVAILSHSLFYVLVLLRKGGEKLDINH